MNAALVSDLPAQGLRAGVHADIRRMLDRFFASDARVADWLEQTPADVAASPARLAERARAFFAANTSRWDRQQLASILIDGAAGRSREQARALENPDTVAVVTGQQPAVGGGPLYTLVKAAQAVSLARRIDGEGQRCVPIFWCASEDHDHGEANHADLVRADGSLERFSGDLRGRASLRFQPVARWWDSFLARCRAVLGPGPGADWLEGSAPLDRREGLGAWLCRLMTRLFADDGLICIEGHRLRPLWTATLARALDAWPAGELAELRAEIISVGGSDAFGALDHPPLFLDLPDGRVAIDPAAARAQLLLTPTALSPGAALRPLLQQAALPAPFFVAGPGEIAYSVFLRPLYAALDVPRPLLMPRLSVTLVPAAVRVGLQKWSRSVESALHGDHPPPCAATAGLVPALGYIEDAIRELEAAGARLDHDRRRRVSAATTRLRHGQRTLFDSLSRAERKAQGLPAYGPLVAQLRPRDQPQDRVMCLAQAIWQYGPALARALVDTADRTAPGQMAILPLADSA